MQWLLDNPLAGGVIIFVILGLLYATVAYFMPDIARYIQKRRARAPS